jgi:ABC-type sugar transport system substrate-binding protein
MNDQLPAQFTFRPGDPGYAEELAGFQTGFTLRPGLIVGATDADEVRAAVVFAAARGLPVAVQATGTVWPAPPRAGY